jgi:amino-acid N-acetyltransferase
MKKKIRQKQRNALGCAPEQAGAMLVRKAKLTDVHDLQQILAHYAREGKLLARSLSELYAHLRDMFVCVEPQGGQVVGCCALHIVWENLAEIRSAAVLESFKGRGIGRQLVEACIAEARELEIARLFLLTIETGFFEHLGFRIVDKNVLPHKIWADCIHCPKYPECDETAMVLDLSGH